MEDFMLKAGFDIGGTKCAAVLGRMNDQGEISVIGRTAFATREAGGPQACIERLCDALTELLQNCAPGETPDGVGISCGGPLDADKGIIQSPPNLPGWDDIPVVDIVSRRTGFPAKLENDANACALAEWRFGAGRGTRNMIFLTFGTGLGAGVILNGQLYGGTNGMAGECGHIRLAPEGPVGYGKAGSFEGFCSGGGIARLGRMRAEKAMADGKPFAWCLNTDALDEITARSIADAANSGDPDAIEIYAESGRKLGYGLSILIDILNPERIVIGSVFARSENLLRPAMEEVLKQETLGASLQVCRVVPAELGEAIGDLASLAII